MPIRFACADCGARIKVPDGSEGRKVRCPKCDTSQRVPEVSDVAVDEQPEEDPAAALAELGENAPAMNLPSEENPKPTPPDEPREAPKEPEGDTSDDDQADEAASAEDLSEEPAPTGDAEQADEPAGSSDEGEDEVEEAEPADDEPAAETPAVPVPTDGKPVEMLKPGKEGGPRPKPAAGPKLIALLVAGWTLRAFAVLAVIGTLQIVLADPEEANLGLISREAGGLFGMGFAVLLWGVGEIAHALRRSLRQR